MFEQQGSHILQEKKSICWTYFLRQSTMILLKLFMAVLLNSTGHSIKYLSYLTPIDPDTSMQSIPQIESMTCQTLRLDGHLNFTLGNTYHAAASDFGNRIHLLPAAVLYPKSVSDISSVIKCVYDMGTSSELTIAARGHGHSLQGQAQAENGIVISMESLSTSANKMQIHYTGQVKDKQPAYVDVSGGDLWINILKGTLKHGFSPRSWTDYLHLTVGGTLSNAGISGQAFRHGPQINNVYQLEVVTGTGNVVMCSEKQNADLFYGVLGGLGQLGIITKARIAIELAPTMVKWIRVLYSDFHLFTKDQEQLISFHNSFDYIEGFVIINRSSLLYNWRLTFNPKDPLQVQQFRSEGRTLYCLEMAKYYNPEDNDMEEGIEDLLSRLNYIQHTLFQTDVPYIEFLDRVHSSEVKLKEKGLWDVPHPWLNLLVPKSKIHIFAQEVFGNILTDNGNGPILLYPVNQSRWSNRISMVTPEEEVFYLVAFLSSAVPSLAGSKGLEHILSQNQRILDYCEETKLGVKQYLARHGTQEDWRAHFGPKWKAFARRKSAYDPLAILAPGQGIFRKASNILGHQSSLQVQDT